MKYLAEVNANPIIVNKKGQTPLQLFNDKFNESHPLATLSRPTRLGSAKGAPAGHQKLHPSASVVISQGDSMAEKIKGIRQILSKSSEGGM